MPELGGGVTLGAWDGRVERGRLRGGGIATSPGEPAAPGLGTLPLADQERRSRPLSLLIALGLHLVLLSLAFAPRALPEVQLPQPAGAIRVSRWMPAPPPRTRARERVVQQDVEARRIPVPDPTPEDPEPVPEPAANDVEIVPDVQVVLGPAVPPGEPGAPVPAGSAGVSYPVLIESSRVQPRYPEAARRAKVTGNVIVEAVVRKDGTVGDIQFLRTPGPGLGFEEAALEAVSRWRFRPGLLRGQPVDVRFTIVVEFILR